MNPRPLAPHASALPLRYNPTLLMSRSRGLTVSPDTLTFNSVRPVLAVAGEAVHLLASRRRLEPPCKRATPALWPDNEQIIRNFGILVHMVWQVIFLIILILLGSAAYAGIQGAPWVPTWKRDMKRVGELLRLAPEDKFVELGCGNARVCRHLKQEQPQADVTGVELSLLQYGVGWLQNRLAGSGVKMKLENAFKHDLSGYDALYLFLMPETYQKIRPKLETELKPGSRVVSYVWPILGWEATRVDEREGAPKLYYYER